MGHFKYIMKIFITATWHIYANSSFMSAFSLSVLSWIDITHMKMDFVSMCGSYARQCHIGITRCHHLGHYKDAHIDLVNEEHAAHYILPTCMFCNWIQIMHQLSSEDSFSLTLWTYKDMSQKNKQEYDAG